MIKVQAFSQRDPKWRNNKMGKSGLRIHDYGCTITILASLLCSVGYRETPKTVNRKLTAHRGYYKSTALLLWNAVPRIWPKTKFVRRAYNYNNPVVAWYVYIKKMPVMVQVSAAKIGAYRHWVLFIGSRKMMDPWTGKIVSTSTYPATGYALIDRV
jgi:hypothetical protein